LNRYLIGQVISFEISEMRPLFVICQMCPNTFGLTKVRVRSSNCDDLLVFASTTRHPDYLTLWPISPHLRIDDKAPSVGPPGLVCSTGISDRVWAGESRAAPAPHITKVKSILVFIYSFPL
jgi:hypothetical protein